MPPMPPASLRPASPRVSYAERFWGSERISYLLGHGCRGYDEAGTLMTDERNDVRVGHFLEEFRVAALVWMES